MIRTVLIDEDKDAREDILNKVAQVSPDIFILSSVSDLHAACSVIEEHDPELVISEAQFSGNDAIDVFNSLNDIHFKLLLITNTNKYAIDAVKLGAIDYLLKPVDEEALKMAIEKALKLIEQDKLLESWLMSKNLLEDNVKRKKIAIKEEGNIFIVRVADIVYLTAAGEGVTDFVIWENRKIHVAQPFTKYLNILKDSGFIRIGKTYLVNCNFIERFDKGDGGYIVLKGSYRLPVAPREKEQLLTTFRQIS